MFSLLGLAVRVPIVHFPSGFVLLVVRGVGGAPLGGASEGCMQADHILLRLLSVLLLRLHFGGNHGTAALGGGSEGCMAAEELLANPSAELLVLNSTMQCIGGVDFAAT